MTHIIRIDAFGPGNFQLRRVGDPNTTDIFKVAPGDSIRFVAYRNNSPIDYQIAFKSPARSPFTDIVQINMPHGGITQELVVTTLLAGGMPFNIMIPSLGWHYDPEILVDGSTFNPTLQHLIEAVEKLIEVKTLAAPRVRADNPITVSVNGSSFTFTPTTDPLIVHPGDTISWAVTQAGQSTPNFSINFSAASAPMSPLDNFENGISADYWNGATANVSSRIFRHLQLSEGASKDFTYTIAMTTGTAPVSQTRTIRLMAS